MVFIRMNIPRRGYFFTRLYKNYIYLVLPYGEFSFGNSHNLLANPLLFLTQITNLLFVLKLSAAKTNFYAEL